jgi:hypothetical protein
MIIHNVEQNTDEWMELRAGKPTASMAASLVTSKGEPSKSMPEYAMQLAADLYAGVAGLDQWRGNAATERGHEMEDRARAYYENTFPDREISRVGFVTDDDEAYGCSPDSLVDDDGVLEIKCQQAKGHVATLLHYKKHGHQLSTHVAQPQAQILIAERDWADLLYWHPELPALLIRCEPDEKIIVNLRLQIASCIDERDRVIKILNEF